MKKLFFKFSLTSVSLLLLPLSNLITTPLLSRLLGPQGKGELVLILQPMTIVDAISGVGISSYLISRSRKNRKNGDEESNFLFPLVIGSVFGFLLLVVWYLLFISSWVKTGIFVVICYSALPLGTWISIQRARLIIRGLRRPLILETFFNAGLRVAIVVGFYCFKVEDPEIIAIMFILIGVLSGLFCLRPPSLRKQLLEVSSWQIRKLKLPALNFWLFDIITITSSRLDQILISSVYTKFQLGIYSVAIVVAELPAIVGNAVSRELINQKREGSERGRHFILAAEISFVAACTCAYFGAFLIPSLFGVQFGDAVKMCQLLLIATFFQIHIQLISTFMLINALEKKRYPLYLIPLVTMFLGIIASEQLQVSIHFFIKVLIVGWSLSLVYGLFILCNAKKVRLRDIELPKNRNSS